MPHSHALAEFIGTAGAKSVPADLRDLAAKSVFSALVAGRAALDDAQNRAILATLRDVSGAGDCATFDPASPLDLSHAAFANGFLANALDFDDTHEGTILHPTSPVLGAVSALVQKRASTPADAMTAFTLGVEVACRIADAVSPEHYDRGWHITATCGIFGAAAAAGHLLSLSPAQLVNAFGHAAAQAGGTVENLGTSAKSIGVGQAARGGLMAALFAARGVEGPKTPLEGRLGWLSLVHETPRLAALTDGLGTHWSFARNMLKPYPCGVVLNPVIEAALALQPQLPPADKITSLTITGHPLLKVRTDRPHARQARELQVCAQHAVSAALLRGRFGQQEVSETSAQDPQILALRPKVAPLVAAEGYAIEAAHLLVETSVGVFEHSVTAAKGSLALPLGWQDLEEKASCVSSDAERLRSLAEVLWDKTTIPDLLKALA